MRTIIPPDRPSEKTNPMSVADPQNSKSDFVDDSRKTCLLETKTDGFAYPSCLSTEAKAVALNLVENLQTQPLNQSLPTAKLVPRVEKIFFLGVSQLFW
jgi:hypothetical protein